MFFSRFYIIPLLLTICFSLSAEDKFGDYAKISKDTITWKGEVFKKEK